MDDRKNIPQNENLPSGFDFVSKGETVDNSVPSGEEEKNTLESNNEAKTENSENSAPQSENVVTQTGEEVKEEASSVKDFLPNGTYSYSAAKGNLPDSATNEPVNVKEESSYSAPLAENDNAEPKAPKQNYNYYTSANKKEKKPKTKKYGFGVIAVSIVLSVVLGLGSGIAGTYIMLNNSNYNENNSSDTPKKITNISVNESASSTTEAVAKKAGPSVIGIRTTAAVTNFFFGTSESTEEGSGIIYSEDGYIITNYHVIQSAVESSNSKVEVYLSDDTQKAYEADVVGYNISSDLAVVKINAKGLTAIEFADSKNLVVGQTVIAIGNPGGLEFIGSVSTGVTSGLNRTITVDTGSTMSLIQTDAAINPGNSGGALVDTSGKLIGVNSVKLLSESFEGMGFAIPANTVKEICDKIISKENAPTPYLGLQISQTYTAEKLSALGYPAGAVVVSVTSGGPADEGGIERGDIITEFNGVSIKNHTNLDDAINDCEPGDSVTVKIYRKGSFYSTNINVEANNEK